MTITRGISFLELKRRLFCVTLGIALTLCLASCQQSYYSQNSGVYALDFVEIAESRLKEHNLEFPGIGGGGRRSSSTKKSYRSQLMMITGGDTDADAFFSDFRNDCENAIRSAGVEVLGFSRTENFDFTFDYSDHGHRGVICARKTQTLDGYELQIQIFEAHF